MLDYHASDDESDDSLLDGEKSDDWTSETVPCPQCGAEVYEDAERCPVCETYITHEQAVWSGRPIWWIILGLAGILATIFALLG